METKITIPLTLEYSESLSRTLKIFKDLKNKVSVTTFNEGKKPLNAVQIHRKEYQNIKGILTSQMTITSFRCVAGAYASAWTQRKNREIKKPFVFKKDMAVFLIGDRSRDAAFKADGKLSISTVDGRVFLNYNVPEHYRGIFDSSKKDSLTVVEIDGKLSGKLCCTIEVPEGSGINPVGIDLNQTNTLVATDTDNRTLFISGLDVKIRNKRNRKTRSRLQKRLAQKKAQKGSTRSVRRTLKRLGKRISNRNKTFSCVVAKELCEWSKENTVFVFEDLIGIKKKKKYSDRKGNIRKSNEWNHSQIRLAIEHKAKFYGFKTVMIDPAYTSQICSKCGSIGNRKKHSFKCDCGHTEHADINASKNIRNRFTILRSSGVQSITPEALVSNDVGQTLKGI